MIQKSSILTPADKCGVLSVNTYHLFRGFSRKFSRFGDFLRVSVRKTKPDSVIIKGMKRKAIIIRTKKNIYLCDGTTVRFNYNSVVLLKKRLTPEGKEIFGPILRNLKKKKFLSSFSGLI